MKKLILLLTLIPNLLFSQTLPPFTLDQEKFLSDKKGALLIKNIIDLKVGDSVSFSTQDGKEIKGKIFLIEIEEGNFLKIYGHTLEDEKSGFGFIFSKEEGLNGALVLKKVNTDYCIIHNSVDNSFYFIKVITPKTINL